MSTSTALPATQTHSAAAGIACVVGGIFFLTLSDANAKWLGSAYNPLQILFLRALIALPFVMTLALWLGGRRVLRTTHPGLHLTRGAINVVSACCFYLGLRALPLAEATAIAFAAPLFVTALSVLILKERVDGKRWLAVLAGFAGVLIVVRPGTAAFQAATLLPLTTALLYAVMMITARGISRGEGMLTTTFYIVLGQLVCSAVGLPWVWRTPAMDDLPYFGAVALFSTLGLALITQGFRIGPASVVAPFDYTGLIWATILGWLFWREAPDAYAYLGALFIAGSGVYIAVREARAKARTRRPAAG
ncbi:DMT family transporter [Achromobacter agilis]|uniref:Riboflavin transporter n=1 Tax=Achromobacter agilis TaxID=1353888 RepID=A0A446CGK5_9BURK|nr:DMT family transporter [Achromobacter agilis]SSW66951.1 Riboflavin transporter [Achromobacter agilis]